nr:hypothetical protein [Tanacetum cinerariifolium]
MNLGTSSQSQPQQERLVDTTPNSPPHSPTQASQSESSPAEKGKSKGKGRKPRPKKNRYHNKWCGVKSVGPGRRVCTVWDLEESNELFQDDTILRPPGKLRPSKSQRSHSSRSEGSSLTGKGSEAFKEMA